MVFREHLHIIIRPGLQVSQGGSGDDAIVTCILPRAGRGIRGPRCAILHIIVGYRRLAFVFRRIPTDLQCGERSLRDGWCSRCIGPLGDIINADGNCQRITLECTRAGTACRFHFDYIGGLRLIIRHILQPQFVRILNLKLRLIGTACHRVAADAVLRIGIRC